MSLPSSRSVNRPIWGKSLKVSKQMTPAARSLAIHTWSCLTKRGRVLLFSPVFLSTRQIKACSQDLKSLNHSPDKARREIKKKLLAEQIKWITLNTVDRFSIGSNSLWFALLQCRCGCEGQHCNRGKWLICAQWWRSEIKRSKWERSSEIFKIKNHNQVI